MGTTGITLWNSGNIERFARNGAFGGGVPGGVRFVGLSKSNPFATIGCAIPSVAAAQCLFGNLDVAHSNLYGNKWRNFLGDDYFVGFSAYRNFVTKNLERRIDSSQPKRQCVVPATTTHLGPIGGTDFAAINTHCRGSLSRFCGASRGSAGYVGRLRRRGTLLDMVVLDYRCALAGFLSYGCSLLERVLFCID